MPEKKKYVEMRYKTENIKMLCIKNVYYSTVT